MTQTQPDRRASGNNALVRLLKQRWLTIVLVILAIIFIAQNRDTVPVHLFWVKIESPLWLWLTILFVVGLIAGAATFKRRAQRKLQRKQPQG